MKNLILVLATIATVSLGAVFTCDEAGYNAYLTTYESKCAKFPLDMCDAETFRYALDDFVLACQFFNSRNKYSDYDMEMTLLADWDYDALASLMQIYFDYSHTPSYYEPIDAIQAEGDIFVHPYSDCVQEGKQIRSAAPMNHTVDETCNMSYLYATALTFEAAYFRATGEEIRFSTDYLQTCVFDPKWNCEGTDPRELVQRASSQGMMTWAGWDAVVELYEKDQSEPICTIAERYVIDNGYFITGNLDSRNRGGLMNFFVDYVPMAILALDFDKLRFVQNMVQKTEIREDYVTLRAGYDNPTLFAVVSGYYTSPEAGYWRVQSNVLPCMPIDLYLPMTLNETNANYAGIAGYVSGVQFIVDEPTTEAPTTEAPTTEAPTTEAPTTEAPTTEAPTTEGPTESPFLRIMHPFNYTKVAECTTAGMTEEECPFSPANYLAMITANPNPIDVYLNTVVLSFYIGGPKANVNKVNAMMKDLAIFLSTIPDLRTARPTPPPMYIVTDAILSNSSDGLISLLQVLGIEELYIDYTGELDLASLNNLPFALAGSSVKKLEIFGVDASLYTILDGAYHFEAPLTTILAEASMESVKMHKPDTVTDPITDMTISGKPFVADTTMTAVADVCVGYEESVRSYCEFFWYPTASE